MSEKGIERQVCKYAKDCGILTYKFLSPNNRGVPDRIFLFRKRVLFIEFKTPEGKVSQLQEVQARRLMERGFEVRICFNVEAGKQMIDSFLDDDAC